MTQEQKAKAYDLAIEAAKKYHNGTLKDVMETIFPELKESEDERIREALMDFFYRGAENGEQTNGVCDKDILAWLEKQKEFVSADFDDVWETADCDELTAPLEKYSKDAIKEMCHAWYDKGIELERKNWLEKQGEQNLVNETDEEIVEAVKDTSVLDLVEPKFKVGNWYQCTKDFFGKGVTFDKNTAYYCAKEGCLQCEYGCHIAIVKDLYDNFKLWTIKDAKDCDVLAVENMIFVYKGVLASHIVSYCKLFNNKFECFGDVRTCCAGNSKVHPATKEQRETLLKAMADAGYAFDFEKKELKKIEQNPAEWSEEDEMIALSIEQVMNCASLLNIVPEKIDKIRTWLKSLKDRYTWKPSEEQMKYLHKYAEQNNYDGAVLTDLYNDLKKLKGE